MMMTLFRFFFLVSATLPVVTESQEDGECLQLSCCENDCCGPSTSWNGVDSCVQDQESRGWSGVHLPSFNPFCGVRQCCEGNCCSAPGTVWDPTTLYCFGYPIEIPYDPPEWIPEPEIVEEPSYSPTQPELVSEPSSMPSVAPTTNATASCNCTPASKTLVYSRGNNNVGEMVAQFMATGKYIYETAKFHVGITLNPDQCVCIANKCTGTKVVELTLRISGLAPFWVRRLVGRVVLPTKPSKGTTAVAAKPGPNFETHVDTDIDFPAATKESTFAEPNLEIKAKHEIPCEEGTHLSRFWIVPGEYSKKKMINPGRDLGLLAYIDVATTLKEVVACHLDATVEAYLLEYFPKYDFTHRGRCPSAPNELPDVKHVGPGVDDGSTDNIAKIHKEDGEEVDSEFPEED